MSNGGHSKTEGWNLQLQGRVRDLEADLAEAEQHIASLMSPYSRAEGEARAFLKRMTDKRETAQAQAADIDKFLEETSP